MNKLKLFSKICFIIIGLILVFGFAKNTYAAMSIAGRLNLGTNISVNSSGTFMVSGDFMYFTYSKLTYRYWFDSNPSGKANYIAKIKISDFSIVSTKELANVINVNGHESIDSNGEYIYLSADTGASLNSTYYPDIVKIRTSDLSIVKTLRLNQSEEHGPHGAVIDKDNQYIYVVALVGGGYAVPARIIKIRTSDFARVGNLDYSSSGGGQMMIDNNNQYLYADYGSSISDYSVAKISLSNFGVVNRISYNSGGEPYSITAINKDNTSGLFMGGSYGQLRKYSLLNFSGLGTIGIGSIGQYLQNVRATIDKNDAYAYSVSKTYVTKINYSTMVGFENFTGFNSNDNVMGPVKIDSNCEYLYSGGYLDGLFHFPSSRTGIIYKIATSDYCGGPPTVTLMANPSTINPGQSSTLTWASQYASFVGGSTGFTAITVNGSTQVSPDSNATYTITVCNNQGCATATTNIGVNTPPGSFTLTGTADCSSSIPANPSNNLTWTSSSGATSYDIYRKKVGDSVFGKLNSVTTNSYNDTTLGVTSGSSYVYYVNAINGALSTKSNNEVSITARDCSMTATITCPIDPTDSARCVAEKGVDVSFFGYAIDHGGTRSTTYTYSWLLGDGTTSALQNPLPHSYAEVKTYTVILTAKSSRPGVSVIVTKDIRITEPPPPPPAAFRGIFVGGTITISRVNALSIIYDSNSVNNPPPGFVNFFAPSWQEVAP